jgi:thioredoxin reductase
MRYTRPQPTTTPRSVNPMLYDAGQGKLLADLFKGKKVLVVGGGNVAFDAARVARK